MTMKNLLGHLRKNKRALSPAISSTILTSAIIVMILVVVVFANNYLDARLAENEFGAMNQFMQTIGLQIDDVAWIPGRTETMRYASMYGSVSVQTPALNYSFYKDGTVSANFTVGVMMFVIPVNVYSLGSNYFDQIFPSSTSFLQQNTSAPVSRLFIVEKLPMPDGNYVRIVVAPIIRQLSSTVNNVTYVELYLPILENGPSPHLSQSVTLCGGNLGQYTISNAHNLTIGMSFPNQGIGLTSDFFGFASTSETVNVTPNTVVEIYTGSVTVSLGLNG